MKGKKAQTDVLYSGAKPLILILTLMFLTIIILLISFTKSKAESYMFSVEGDMLGEYYTYIFYRCAFNDKDNFIMNKQRLEEQDFQECILDSDFFNTQVCYRLKLKKDVKMVGECQGLREKNFFYSFNILIKENGKLEKIPVEIGTKFKE